MPLSAIYSWHVPDAGIPWWGHLFAQLFAEIDVTVASIQASITAQPTLVLSIGAPFPNSFVSVPRSAMLPTDTWQVLSLEGGRAGTFTVVRSGSYVLAELFGPGGLSDPTVLTGSPLGGIQFRLVLNPGSFLLGNLNSAFLAPGSPFEAWGGRIVASIGQGVYTVEPQFSYVTSAVAFPAGALLYQDPLQVLMTEVRSF